LSIDAAPLLDNMVRSDEDGPRDREAESPGGLQVDDQLELRRLLHGQVGGLRAFEDLVDVGGSASVQVGQIRP
jgi:hypothetical protein